MSQSRRQQSYVRVNRKVAGLLLFFKARTTARAQRTKIVDRIMFTYLFIMDW
jgi:hypothetical protein